MGDFRVRHLLEIPERKCHSLLLWKLRNRHSHYELQLGRLDLRYGTAIGCDIKVSKLDWLLPPQTIQRSTDGNAPQPTTFVLCSCKVSAVPCKGKHFLNDVLRIVFISENSPGAPVDHRSIGIDKCSPFDRQRTFSQSHFCLTHNDLSHQVRKCQSEDLPLSEISARQVSSYRRRKCSHLSDSLISRHSRSIRWKARVTLHHGQFISSDSLCQNQGG